MEPLLGKERPHRLQHGLLFLQVVVLYLLLRHEQGLARMQVRHHGQDGVAVLVPEPLVVCGDVGEHAPGVLAAVDREQDLQVRSLQCHLSADHCATRCMVRR